MRNSDNILVFIALTMSLTTTAFATEQNNSATTAYVDSVHQWGAWELDIEPAAGGIQQLSTQALNARGSKVALRTNSVSALAPPATPQPVIIASTPPTPAPTMPASISPVLPVAPTTFAPAAATPVTTVSAPPSPSVAPVTPTTTVPSGTSGLF